MDRRLAAPLLAVAALLPSGRPAAAGDAPSAAPGPAAKSAPAVERPALPQETHLKNIRQLTFGGENAEAYWSFAGDRLVFQSTRPPYTADQIFTMRPDGSDVRLVSPGMGRTTCAFYMPGDQRILFASTHHEGYAPPTPPDRSQGYVWGIFAYDLYTVGVDGQDLRRHTDSPGYDAEATVSPKGDRIVFTSSRDGDLDVYIMAIDGTDVKRLTDEVGYDGGAVFSPDGSKIAWRASRPADEEGRAKFKALLDKGLVRPSQLELFVMDVDGSNKRQVTKNGKANFGPFFAPDGKRILYCSNQDCPKGRSFDLYLVGLDGTGTERVTWYSNDAHDDFDGFPMFSPDGKRLAWCSNRFNAKPNETNVFVADWQD